MVFKALKTVDELPVAGRRVFLRVDFNVPRDKAGKITDDTRIREALPTIQYLIDQKAKIIVASHLGRPKGRDPQESLFEIAERLSELLGRPVVFPEDCIGDAVKKLVQELHEGGIVLLENLRFHKEEEANDPNFAELLAQLAEVYVTDAFGALHRAHASTAGMVKYFKEKGIGFLVRKELQFLKVLQEPERPFIAVLGGAKVSDKIGLIESLVSRVDGLLLGGGLAYTFLKAQGIPTGRSRVEEEKVYVAHKIIDKAKVHGVPLYVPTDHCVADRLEAGVPSQIVRRIPEDKMGLDIGPETIAKYERILETAKTVFWNGPMGVFEIPAFANGSLAIAKAIAKSGAISVIGGGESVAAAKMSGVADKISHLSTGGGATLEFLEGKVLPGFKALEG